MSKFGSLLDRLYVSSFKRTSNGWLFEPRLFLARRTHLVTDEQKTTLLGALRRLSVIQCLAVIVTLFAADRLLANHLDLDWLLDLGLKMVVLFFVLTILSWVYAALIIRPLLSGVTPVDEHIAFSDRLRQQASILPRAVIFVLLFLSLVFVAIGLGIGVDQGWNSTAISGTAFFGITSLCYIVLLFAARRRAAK